MNASSDPHLTPIPDAVRDAALKKFNEIALKQQKNLRHPPEVLKFVDDMHRDLPQMESMDQLEGCFALYFPMIKSAYIQGQIIIDTEMALRDCLVSYFNHVCETLRLPPEIHKGRPEIPAEARNVGIKAFAAEAAKNKSLSVAQDQYLGRLIRAHVLVDSLDDLRMSAKNDLANIQASFTGGIIDLKLKLYFETCVKSYYAGVCQAMGRSNDLDKPERRKS